jgi:hypothetical protein
LKDGNLIPQDIFLRDIYWGARLPQSIFFNVFTEKSELTQHTGEGMLESFLG